MSSGFYKRRRGILEHIEAGTIDLLESGVHDYLSLKANLVIGSPSSWPVGVCFSSAPAIRPHCKRWVKCDRTMQRVLEHMEEIGWIKSWPQRSGNYPVLLCRASVHDLSGNEYRINADATTDWQHPVYEPVGELSGSCPQLVGKVATLREKRVESAEKRNTPAAKPAPPSVQPADPLELETKEAAFGVFWEQWPRKQAKPDARRAWMKIPISEYATIMSGIEKWQKSDQWARDIIPHPATWLNQKRWQDEDIPQSAGGGNGKFESYDERRRRESEEAIRRVHQSADELVSKMEPCLPEPRRDGTTNRRLC